MVVEGAYAAAIGDATALINDVNAFGPCGIRVVGGIANVVDPEGQCELESLDEIIGDDQALLQRFRLGITDVILIL